MKNKTLLLPGFHLSTLRRKPRSPSQILADERARIRRHSLSQLGDLFSRILPSTVLESDARGVFSRRRLFSKANTFWAFFSQVIDADGGCQEVVRKGPSIRRSPLHANPIGIDFCLLSGTCQT
ncbi:MAG: hypothetical protein RNU03_17705 [Candidatus Sedimenticola sp. (ex Thyasira tokunagai)]